MAERNWTKEMSKIDRQLESISDEALFPTKAGGTKGSKAVKAENLEKQRTTSTLGVFLRLLLSVALGVGIYFWPYDARCGFGLAGYLAAVGVVTASGLWSAVWTWRHRSARGHTLSLLLVLWGVILGAMEVLPRVGYAKADTLHPATWTCR
jgi:membrane protein YdbS with pleckstrin-like domain